MTEALAKALYEADVAANNLGDDAPPWGEQGDFLRGVYAAQAEALLESQAFRDIVEDEVASRYHPEFGTAWRWQDAAEEAHREMDFYRERMYAKKAELHRVWRDVEDLAVNLPVWGPDENGRMWLDVARDDFLADMRTALYGEASRRRRGKR